MANRASAPWLIILDHLLLLVTYLFCCCCQVSAELAAEAADADLLVLEGMGRAIETNLTAKFTADSLKLGMVKHPEVAACLGGRLYDVVCKFDEAGAVKGVQQNAALN
jgi:hypothetical protein